MSLILPSGYVPKLVPELMEQAIFFLKEDFQEGLAAELNLRRVTAPLFVLSGTGVNDDLSGTERAVSFPIKDMNDRRAEVVHSLAKWKRMKLAQYQMPPGYGIYTDMNAIRADEELDNIHSLYVDQWDWERTIAPEDRNLDYLCDVVEAIYDVFKDVERGVYNEYPHIRPILPDQITFVQAEDLLNEYPNLSPKEREHEITRKYGAVFLIGVGHKLSNGEKHDGRAPDYDDWSSETEPGYFGLNGDILLWNPVLKRSLELSSMGIRVDKRALLKQLKLEGCEERRELAFHKALLNDELPLSIGGGIGQSRLCMFFLRCAHIGEVQASIWPPEMIRECAKAGIALR
ncbi:MAG: aspartate--ammonia ligase [Thermoguttaceae bacterium]|nr:aspartate--ammonia ligase [Thermoguttaceae bacterium]